MTYSKDDIRRMREANEAINQLAAAKLRVRPSPSRHYELLALNDAIERWRMTLRFILEGPTI